MAQSTLNKPKTQPRSLSRWLCQQLGQLGLVAKTRQHGNSLHLLLERKTGPEELVCLDRLLTLLETQTGDELLKAEAAPVYRINVYGRHKGEAQPRWSRAIHLNQLERHRCWLTQQLQQEGALAQPALADPAHVSSQSDIPSQSGSIHWVEPALEAGAAIASPAKDRPDSAQPGAAPSPKTSQGDSASIPTHSLIESPLYLAQQGDPDAIARYLSEELSSLGVSVRVAVKSITSEGQAVSLDDAKRLWVLCEAAYSLEASATAELLASRLRALALEGFQDAAVFSQVKGESKPDWSLRVDLTSPRELQWEWARWGDDEAIARLVAHHLQVQGQRVRVRSQLRNKTLNLFFTAKAALAQPLSAQALRDDVAPLLIDLAPQGIHAAVIHCAKPSPKLEAETAARDTASGASPTNSAQGLEWIALPASEHGDLAPTCLELAEQGNLDAIRFLLTRLLNPDLEAQLKTGGLRVQLLRKGDLLHVMCDAPRCPGRRDITRPIATYIRQLRLPKIAGLRIYGRRAGQALPRWQYGRDFVPREGRSELPPQFQVAEAQGGRPAHPGCGQHWCCAIALGPGSGRSRLAAGPAHPAGTRAPGPVADPIPALCPPGARRCSLPRPQACGGFPPCCFF